MKRVLLSLGILSVLITVLFAANAHFIHQPTAVFDGTDVVVSWKEAGLGDNQQITYQATANATATFVCVNGGGQCPNAANKTTVSGPIVATGIFSSGKNGSITASLTLPTPDADGFFCPGGQTLTLADFSYTDIRITDATNGVTAQAKPSSLSATLFTCP